MWRVLLVGIHKTDYGSPVFVPLHPSERWKEPLGRLLEKQESQLDISSLLGYMRTFSLTCGVCEKGTCFRVTGTTRRSARSPRVFERGAVGTGDVQTSLHEGGKKLGASIVGRLCHNSIERWLLGTSLFTHTKQSTFKFASIILQKRWDPQAYPEFDPLAGGVTPL